MVLKVQSWDQEHQHQLGTYQKCKSGNPIPDLWNQKPWGGGLIASSLINPPGDCEAHVWEPVLLIGAADTGLGIQVSRMEPVSKKKSPSAAGAFQVFSPGQRHAVHNWHLDSETSGACSLGINIFPQRAGTGAVCISQMGSKQESPTRGSRGGLGEAELVYRQGIP